ncbi:unnamed protein product [Rotaria sordida]|uniref:EF-hand domain-containing protein n=1 Tax=Rotaria sordida TaxID=392033 RepID=A0A815SYK2_9BILA|nr:unnamed protein product [Rotaria sordida]CAF1241858.1 unnamed protein product [Rotaria sordida]CAF1252489.1 unnamed protein product [Rotaria sordida]CAF1274487.1 unnamed protein product [Rotaria sordida]CAF1498117.1 unnamed protein product [Rotaria sordida]
MDLEYTVTETITTLSGSVIEINYEFEEITVENVQRGVATKRERRSRTYNANITRQLYDSIVRKVDDALPFDEFVNVLRPFMMGFYERNELEQAFSILDRDRSGTVHVDELSAFLPVINESATRDTLEHYIKQVYSSVENDLNFDEFRELILKGIGREILCHSS